MARSVERSGIEDVIVATSFPSHHEIVLPNSEINVETSDAGSTVSDIKALNIRRQVTEDYPQYAQIDIKVQPPTPPTEAKSPKSIYSFEEESVQKPKISLKNREVSTRQCKFEIGEEWEQFQIRHSESISCPPSPLGGRTCDHVYSADNPGYAASEPGAEIDQDLTDSSEKTKDPFPFHLFFSSSTSGVKEHQIVPNPFNKLNHRFHSTLQCPCFLFFFFLCCLPGVHFMQQSDNQFKKGNRNQARKYGTVSTVMYLAGIVFGMTFLAVAIYFAADYVKQFL